MLYVIPDVKHPGLAVSLRLTSSQQLPATPVDREGVRLGPDNNDDYYIVMIG